MLSQERAAYMFDISKTSLSLFKFNIKIQLPHPASAEILVVAPIVIPKYKKGITG